MAKRKVSKLIGRLRDKNDDLQSIIDSMYGEFVQLTVACAKRELEIDYDIIITFNKEFWHHHFPYLRAKIDRRVLGRVAVEHQYIYLKPDDQNLTLKRLRETIYHEMLHIKHPKWSHKKIAKKLKKFVR